MNLLAAMPVIDSLCLESIGIDSNVATGYGSAVWPTANLAIFVPFTVSAPYAIQRIGWMNGAAVSGNVDAGVYAVDGTKLASLGATAQSGTNAVQSAALSLTLAPGKYYMALVVDNITGTIQRQNPSLQNLRFAGVLEMAAAYPLPATATFATPANANIPSVCIMNRSFF